MKKLLFYNIIIFFAFINLSLAVTPVSIHKDWTLFKTKLSEKDICYIASLSINKQGNYKKRGEPYVIVTREKGATYDEISLSSGFLYDPDKDIEVSILKRKFPMFSNEEKAWTYDRNDDIEMVKQMKAGSKMYVTGYSKAGTFANDTYSLNGFSDAYEGLLNCSKN